MEEFYPFIYQSDEDVNDFETIPLYIEEPIYHINVPLQDQDAENFSVVIIDLF